jgi:transcriptional regulator with XRE-family HTH domain
MSTAYQPTPDAGFTRTAAFGPAAEERPLHRLGEVRRREGLSRRAIARRLRISIGEVTRQERQSTDMPLSMLYRWQAALDVPVAELLSETDQPLSTVVQQRGQLLRVMKTAVTILQRSRQPAIRRMAEVLVDQLKEMMPELEGVGPWPSVGKRRTADELGQVVHRRLPSQLSMNLEEPD